MDHLPPAGPPDLTLQLPRDLYYQIVHTLTALLPAPVTVAPEDPGSSPGQAPGSSPGQAQIRRDNAAIAQVASLLPANAEEVALAAQFVAANAQAMDCLLLARQHPGDPSLILKCTAQSASMMRQARGARALLLRVQAVRQKREADGVALGKAAWIEHCAVGLMADALGREAPAPMAEPAPEPAPAPAAEPDDKFAQLSEAEQYALIYPRVPR